MVGANHLQFGQNNQGKLDWVFGEVVYSVLSKKQMHLLFWLSHTVELGPSFEKFIKIHWKGGRYFFGIPFEGESGSKKFIGIHWGGKKISFEIGQSVLACLWKVQNEGSYVGMNTRIASHSQSQTPFWPSKLEESMTSSYRSDLWPIEAMMDGGVFWYPRSLPGRLTRQFCSAQKPLVPLDTTVESRKKHTMGLEHNLTFWTPPLNLVRNIRWA